jgi:hypothetical protein
MIFRWQRDLDNMGLYMVDLDVYENPKLCGKNK